MKQSTRVHPGAQWPLLRVVPHVFEPNPISFVFSR